METKRSKLERNFKEDFIHMQQEHSQDLNAGGGRENAHNKERETLGRGERQLVEKREAEEKSSPEREMTWK